MLRERESQRARERVSERERERRERVICVLRTKYNIEIVLL